MRVGVAVAAVDTNIMENMVVNAASEGCLPWDTNQSVSSLWLKK
jgi:hypothetical protein